MLTVRSGPELRCHSTLTLVFALSLIMQVSTFGLSPRVQVVEADALGDTGKEHLRAADIVVMHNVFEFFTTKEEVNRTRVKHGHLAFRSRFHSVRCAQATLHRTRLTAAVWA